MNKYSLSVIIPNYNKEKYISKCVESIINQTLVPDEIIIVDDCSSDNSKKIILELENKYDIVHGIYLDANYGVSHARNVGLANATCNYISFTDSDDYIYNKTKYEKEMGLIRRYKEIKEMDIIAYSCYIRVNEDGLPFAIRKLNKSWYLSGNIFWGLLARIKRETIPRDYCVRKEVIEYVGAYNEKISFYEDLDLLFRLSKSYLFFSTYDFGVAYRLTHNGLSQRPISEHKRIVKEMIKNYTEGGVLEKIKIYIIKLGWFFEKAILRIIRRIKRILNSNTEIKRP